MKTRWAALVILGVFGACGQDAAEPPAMDKGLIILGFDGMDPKLLRTYIAAGKVPHLAALAERGTFLELGTSNPPQSPVAWSNFITGMGSSAHGIYDFVHRDPHHLEPYLSTSRTAPPGTVLTIGDWVLPLGSGGTELLRAGQAWWQALEKGVVPATVMRVPANYPPAERGDGRVRSESMAGMGTPDLLGTYGTFQLYTDDPALAARPMGSGVVHAVDFGDTNKVRSVLEGPPAPSSASAKAMTIPVAVARDGQRDVALVRIGDREAILEAGEWSEWLPVAFDGGVLSGELGGMVRLYLRSVRPHLHLYVSPINIDPVAPAMELSSPASYVEKLAAEVGRFYTQGMPEDTKALSGGALTDDEFLAQADYIWQEEVAFAERELKRYRGGALFLYFSVIDQVSHMFWRALEPDAAPEDARYADVIPGLYERADALVGRILQAAPPGTEVVVMSDHGFNSYRYKVHLNTWLAQNGYLQVLPPDERQPGPLGHIDWANTQAYALGLNQLFLNLKGREQHGVVPLEDKELLLRRLTRELESFRDPSTGGLVITDVTAPADGAFPDRTPDLLIGYNRGYRSSDESAMGVVGSEVIERNRGKWSGDHCVDPAHVPGVLLTERKLEVTQANLTDLAPTILSYFGLDRSEALEGADVFAGSTAAASQ